VHDHVEAAPVPVKSGVTAWQDLTKGFWRNNPVFVQMLGLCPAMAVTNSVRNALTMAVATTFVLVGSNVLVSTFRKVIPGEVRISTYVIIIAAFVQVIDMVLQAFTPVTHAQLGAFVALIVVNCIVLARQEAFTSKNTVWRSFLDGAGMSVGFTIALTLIGSIREVLGSGTWLGFRVLPAGFEPWVIMNMPPGGFLTFGAILLALSWFAEQRKRRAKMLALAGASFAARAGAVARKEAA
jgi:electron transport complex protein RnfE